VTTNDVSGGRSDYSPISTDNPMDAAATIALVPADFDGIDDLVRDVNEKLRYLGSGWRLNNTDAGLHPFVIPLELTYLPVERRPITNASRVLRLLDEVGGPVPAVLDPLLVGAPAYKPHALTRGDFSRVPVHVLPEEAPPRRVASGRRPVVALLDTAVVAHDGLGGEADKDLGGNGFWVDASAMGWKPGQRLDLFPPVEHGDLHRELADQEGHGTFCAGLVRQVAPDAQVLAVRVMRDDGRIYGDHLLNALYWLVKDEADEPDQILRAGDVVCIPAGFQPMFPRDRQYLHWLGVVLTRLTSCGIRVVASAGNDGSQDPVYPAAFAKSPHVRGNAALVSVGAYNPDRATQAYFSNYGDWVTQWEVGTSVVSTFPKVKGVAAPELVIPPRQSADPDDFTGGWARWSGTSFAAAIHAAKLARAQTGPAYGRDATPPSRP